MASREMYDVLERLKKLDKNNPNVINDAVENTEKMNPPVEEAKKAKPDFLDMDKDGDKKEPMKKAIKDKKKKMDEAHKVSKSHVEKMVKDGKTMKQMMDMHPDVDKKELEKMVKDVKESLNESITISADSPEDLPMIAQIMKLAGLQQVSPDMMPDKDNVPMMKPDDNVNGSPYGSEDEEAEEGFANSMGDEREEPTYKGYDPDYAKDAGMATRKTKMIPANSGDNPLESIEDKLRTEYKTFKEELWNALSDGKESTDEGRGRGKLMAGRGRGKVMAGRGRGKMPKEDVKTTEGRGRGKGKKK